MNDQARKALITIYKRTCQYYLRVFDECGLQADHIDPVSRGGLDSARSRSCSENGLFYGSEKTEKTVSGMVFRRGTGPVKKCDRGLFRSFNADIFIYQIGNADLHVEDHTHIVGKPAVFVLIALRPLGWKEILF
jgi:hypothetical protein